MSTRTTTRGQEFPPEPLTPEEVKLLLSTCSQRSSSGLRLRALIAVMYGSGLRIAETLALYPRDLELGDGFVRVRRGKGGRYRTVGLDARSALVLQQWLERRAGLGLNGRHPVFATYTRDQVGRPLAQVYVRNALRRTAAKAGLEKRVHPHGLRHSLATRMAREGEALPAIQAQLGHERPEYTARYIQKLGAFETAEVMRRVNLWGDDDDDKT